MLRAWRDEDLEPFAALNAHAEVMRFFPAPLSRAESDALAARIRREMAECGFGLWAVESPGEAPFLGFVGLSRPSFDAAFTPCVEMGWRLAWRFWGKGYASEGAHAALAHGFGELGLREIVSFTTAENAASRRVMEKLGMARDPPRTSTTRRSGGPPAPPARPLPDDARRVACCAAMTDLLDAALPLWPLVERRADGDARRALRRRRARPHAHLRAAAGRRAAARRPASRRGASARERRVSWQLPTRLEALVLVVALARLGAVQNPILPFLREREVGFIVRQLGARLLIVPAVFRGVRPRRDGARARPRCRGPRRPRGGRRAARRRSRGAPAASPPARPTCAGSSTAPARPPTPRACGTRTVRSGSPGARSSSGSRCAPTTATHSSSRSPTSAESPGSSPGCIAGCAHILVEAFDPKTTRRRARAPRCDRRSARARSSIRRTSPQQRGRGGPSIFPRARLFPGGGAPKPPGLHAEVKRAFGGAGIVAGYGLTEYPIVDAERGRRPRRRARRVRGTRDARHRDPHRRRRDPQVRGGPHLFRGYVDARLDADAFDADGFFRTGDLGHLDAAASSPSPGVSRT